MKVVLPDKTELELPDGATGLDAARAIGPKLAEQAVLLRVERSRRGPALPLADGRRSRSSRPATRGSRRALRPPPLDRPPARRGGPAPLSGRQDRDRPADRERLLLRLRVPRAAPRGGSREDRGRDRRELAEGREWSREEVSRRGGQARLPRARGTYKVELVDTAEGPISFYTQGDFTDLCRGPHLQNSKPIKALKLTGPRRRVLARRRAQHAADAHLRHRVLLRRRPRPLPRRLEEARSATTGDSGSSSTFSTSTNTRRVALLAPEGDGDLERRSRISAGARTGSAATSRSKTPLTLRRGALGHLGTLRRSSARTCS